MKPVPRLKFFYALSWNDLQKVEDEVCEWMEANPDVAVLNIRTIAAADQVSGNRFLTEVLYETSNLKVRA